MPNEETLSQVGNPEAGEIPVIDDSKAVGTAEARRMEIQAGAALVSDGEGDTTETAEQDPTIIAEKYIKSVPEQDRIIDSQQQVEILLYALDSTREKSHLTMTRDRLGNLTSDFQVALKNKDRAMATKLASDFSEDPITAAAGGDKTAVIALSDMPESVRRAILSIILVEGPNSTQRAFGELASRLSNSTEGSIQDVIHSIRKDENFVSDDADNIRRMALKKFLDGVYPDLMSRKDVVLMHKINSLSYQEQEDQQVIKDIVTEIAGVIGGYPFDARMQEQLGGAKNAGELVKGIEDGSIDTSFLISSLMEVLKKFIMEDITKGK